MFFNFQGLLGTDFCRVVFLGLLAKKDSSLILRTMRTILNFGAFFLSISCDNTCYSYVVL